MPPPEATTSNAGRWIALGSGLLMLGQHIVSLLKSRNKNQTQIEVLKITDQSERERGLLQLADRSRREAREADRRADEAVRAYHEKRDELQALQGSRLVHGLPIDLAQRRTSKLGHIARRLDEIAIRFERQAGAATGDSRTALKESAAEFRRDATFIIDVIYPEYQNMQLLEDALNALETDKKTLAEQNAKLIAERVQLANAIKSERDTNAKALATEKQRADDAVKTCEQLQKWKDANEPNLPTAAQLARMKSLVPTAQTTTTLQSA